MRETCIDAAVLKEGTVHDRAIVCRVTKMRPSSPQDLGSLCRRRLGDAIGFPLLSELWELVSVVAGMIMFLSLLVCLAKGYMVVGEDSNTLQSFLWYVHFRAPPDLTLAFLTVEGTLFPVPPSLGSSCGKR